MIGSVPRVTIALLAYNEAASLEAAVHEMHAELVSLGVPFELLVVDDGSSDGTGPLADALAGTLPGVRVVHHPENRGLGGGYRTGFQQARGEVLSFFPADRQFPAEIVADFLPRMAEYDLVLGTIPRRRDTAVGTALSLGERALYRVLFGRLPRFQGILMIRRQLLSEIPLRSTGRGWGVLMELIIRVARGPYRVTSVPTAVRPRAAGDSKVVNARTIAANLRELLLLRLRLR